MGTLRVRIQAKSPHVTHGTHLERLQQGYTSCKQLWRPPGGGERRASCTVSPVLTRWRLGRSDRKTPV